MQALQEPDAREMAHIAGACQASTLEPGRNISCVMALSAFYCQSLTL